MEDNKENVEHGDQLEQVDAIAEIKKMFNDLKESIELNNKKFSEQLNKQDEKFKSFADNYISNKQTETKTENKTEEKEEILDDNDPSYKF